ncbi:transcriptional regulator with XRE-family HTH domain [Sagittula marina]|uniref:Transcriptional regulator with XRE-family HTH domain n=1 Tax=Sagittula marina TaxID=943940 RepID=A0A7W6DN46_9RHOB|nr:transcriptional regulator with XRE-family HTH domain [Sagittula marina]
MGQQFDIEKMRERLDVEIRRQRRSRTEVSLASGQSKGYLTNVLTRGQIPTVDRLDAICRELGLSLPYVMYGTQIPADAEEIFELMQENPERFRALLTLLK